MMRTCAGILCVLAALLARPALADDDDAQPASDHVLRGETTFVYQGHPSFRSPYSGENSLTGSKEAKETWSATLYIGCKLWEGADLWINPEVNQGFGLSNTFGLAGFPSGEAERAGTAYPKLHLQRIFLRQTFGLGGEQETIEGDENEFGGKRDVARITATVGKFSLPDMFDRNAYAHEARTGFMNWALFEAGAFDYPADQFNFTWGGVLELNQKYWAIRAGYVMVPNEPESNHFDTRFPGRAGALVEFELRYALSGEPGKLRVLAFVNRSNAGSYAAALADPDLEIEQTRRTRTKYGFVVNLEQQISEDLGLFSRLSWNDGRSEIIAFTDIDASLSAGAVLRGTAWNRPSDRIGIGGAINALSKPHRDFIAAGGLGIIIGDGRLNYGQEKIFETYYSYNIRKNLDFTLDYQFIADPAYNADRGPVSILTARLHAEF